MDYTIAKHVHVTCVALSLAGFCLRGTLLMLDSPLAKTRVFKVLPHINDSLLLAAAIALTAIIGQYPFIDQWLTAKIFGLIAYILLGAIALKPSRPPRIRLAAGMLAVAVFGWIVSVALTKTLAGWSG